MPSRFWLETWLASLVAGYAIKRAFERETGMTLDEWDELNYWRIMAVPDGDS